MTTQDFIQLLSEGKKVGKGLADYAAMYILQQGEEALTTLWPALYHNNALIRSRAAHVLEAVAKKQPMWFKPHHPEILEKLALYELDPAYNFHLPPLLGLLPWSEDEVPEVVEKLQFWLQHINHQFLKAFCLQSLTDLSLQHPWLQHEAEELLHQHMDKGGKAINARGRMLLKTLAKHRR